MKVQLRESNENYQEGLVHGDPVLNRIFRSRGVQSPDELKYDLNKLLPPNFKDMDKATDIIVKNILLFVNHFLSKNDKTICFIFVFYTKEI